MSFQISNYARLALVPFLLAAGLAGCSSKRWNYVALGDSYPAGYGATRSYVDYYAAHLEADLSVQVEIHNFARTGLASAELLLQVRSDPGVRAALRRAQVITLWVGWNDFQEALALYYAGTCGGVENLDCVHKSAESLNTNLEAILDEILALADPHKTLIRIAEAGIPPVFMDVWKEKGRFETLQVACFESWSGHLLEAAEQRGLTVVHTYRVLNGPRGDEKMKGIYQSDGIHFNDKGQRLIADLHREAGYEYAP